jgi:hypothetical protein
MKMRVLLFVLLGLTAGCASTGTRQSYKNPKGESLTAVQKLLGGGARWAARDGKKALYVNWKDNWSAHHTSNGVDWGRWPDESAMDGWRSSVGQALKAYGFSVKFAGDLPKYSGDLGQYDLLVIYAYWAVEPHHVDLIKEYIANGGSVVILSGVPCYFGVYCKNWSPGSDTVHFNSEWLGFNRYINTGGPARVTIDDPFGAGLAARDVLYFGESGSNAAVDSLKGNAHAVAFWDSGDVFAFMYEYGKGRVYYQSAI